MSSSKVPKATSTAQKVSVSTKSTPTPSSSQAALEIQSINNNYELNSEFIINTGMGMCLSFLGGISVGNPVGVSSCPSITDPNDTDYSMMEWTYQRPVFLDPSKGSALVLSRTINQPLMLVAAINSSQVLVGGE